MRCRYIKGLLLCQMPACKVASGRFLLLLFPLPLLLLLPFFPHCRIQASSEMTNSQVFSQLKLTMLYVPNCFVA